MQILDLTDPSSPVELGFCASSNGPSLGRATGIAVKDSLVYQTDEIGGLIIMDATDTGLPVITDSLNPNFSEPIDVKIRDDLIYAADHARGIFVLKDTDSSGLKLIERIGTEGSPLALALSDSLIHTVDHQDGLIIYEAHITEEPRFSGRWDRDMPYDVAVSGGYALALCENALEVIDLSDPSVSVNTYETEMTLRGIELSEDFAYVSSSEGFFIYRRPTPSTLEPAGSYGTSTLNAAIAGPRAYLACPDRGIVILDISDPDHPVFVNSAVTGGTVNDVKYYDSHLYLAEQTIGIEVLDVSDPFNPVMVGSIEENTFDGTAVCLVHPYAYLASQNGNLVIINRETPSDFAYLGSYPLGGTEMSFGIDACGTQVYLADHFHGLKIIDVSDPAAPFVKWTYDDEIGRLMNVRTYGTRAYVSFSGGMEIIDLE